MLYYIAPMSISELKNAKLWVNIHEVESSAIDQIKQAATHPRLFKHVAIMPDVHTGIGCTIGSVLPIKDALIPSSVGVDIGCGMCAVKSSITLDKVKTKFDDLHNNILRRIPLGFDHRSGRQIDDASDFISPEFRDEIETVQKKYKQTDIVPQLGTLGGGNHFIELQTDSENNIWIMLHSGSRNIGNLIASSAIKKAKELTSENEPAPRDMEYLPIDSKEGEIYLHEMHFAQNFAMQNRFLMMQIFQQEIERVCPEVTYEDVINIHHNYAAKENHFGKDIWVHRKGATKAVSNQFGIIPGSMGTTSYIVRGKDNPESFHSCSHGAGRKMSRSAAKGKYHRKTGELIEGSLSMEDFRFDMTSVFSKDVNRTHLDEAPRAYKNINEVISYQSDLIDVVVELKPVFNIKG